MAQTKSKFIKLINEMGNLGLLNYEEHERVYERIKKNPNLRG